jgi:hypothetical protein
VIVRAAPAIEPPRSIGVARRSRTMRKTSSTLLGLGALAALLAPLAALAQISPRDPVPPTREQILELLDKELPPILDEDNQDLVARLLDPRLGTPLSKSFNRGEVVRALFGRTPPTFDPTCAKTSTPTGDAASDECIASRGSQSGPGAYTQLEFSKHLGFGNIGIVRRAADMEIPPTLIKPVALSDADAYEMGIDFLRSLGVPSEEIPPAPPNAENPFPVKTLVLGFASPTGLRGAIPVQKVVMIRRGLFVGLDDLPFVPGPGDAMVGLDDAGVRTAKVSDWAELARNPRLDPKNAKSRSALTEEIAEELLRELHAPIDSMKFRIHIGGVPDGTRMLLLPALEMSIAQVPNDPTEDQQQETWTTAGQVFDYALVRGSEGGAD